MHIHTLLDLLRADPDDVETRLVLRALSDMIATENDRYDKLLYDSWFDLDQDHRDAFKARTAATWTVQYGQALRVDAVEISAVSGGLNKPTEVIPWRVGFPAVRANRTTGRLDHGTEVFIVAPTLADAMAKVDLRWPLPDWRYELHEIAKPARAEPMEDT